MSNVISCLKLSNQFVEYSTLSDDAAEKEEKKVEPEYFTASFFMLSPGKPFQVTQQKIIIPDISFKMAWFPEVLTPPPAV